jgi:hypothetical protein
MSAPALAPRPSARPSARPAPGRPASARTAAAGRTAQSRSAQARPAQARTGSSRAATARALTGADVQQVTPRPRMRVVQRPDVAPRHIGFAVSCIALLGALMLGLLLLNVAISGNAFTVAELQAERSLLVDQQQSLEQRLLVQSSPASLAARARGLGMVPAPQTIVLAPDGTGAPPVQPVP